MRQCRATNGCHCLPVCQSPTTHTRIHDTHPGTARHALTPSIAGDAQRLGAQQWKPLSSLSPWSPGAGRGGVTRSSAGCTPSRCPTTWCTLRRSTRHARLVGYTSARRFTPPPARTPRHTHTQTHTPDLACPLLVRTLVLEHKPLVRREALRERDRERADGLAVCTPRARRAGAVNRRERQPCTVTTRSSASRAATWRAYRQQRQACASAPCRSTWSWQTTSWRPTSRTSWRRQGGTTHPPCGGH